MHPGSRTYRLMQMERFGQLQVIRVCIKRRWGKNCSPPWNESLEGAAEVVSWRVIYYLLFSMTGSGCSIHRIMYGRMNCQSAILYFQHDLFAAVPTSSSAVK